MKHIIKAATARLEKAASPWGCKVLHEDKTTSAPKENYQLTGAYRSW